MPNYLCRPAELNSSSPVLPEGAQCLELSEDSENLRGRGEEKRERDRWNGGGGGGGGTDRERERERELERKREEVHVNTAVNLIHGHTRTFTDNSTCTLLVRSWMRMKELVPVQQTS